MATKLSEVDQVIIRYADTLSAEAIAFKIEGLMTPVQVLSRIAFLLETPDRLTQLQQDQLITLKMRQLVVQFEEMPLTARNGEVMLRALEAIGARLDKRAASTQKDLSSLYAFQGTIMLDAIGVALEHMRGILTQSGTEPGTWDDALESGLRFAQIELSKHDIDAPDNTDAPVSTNNSAPVSETSKTPVPIITTMTARA